MDQGEGPRFAADAMLGSLARWLRLLGSPFVWRPLVHGSASGATFTRSLARSGAYLARSWLGRTATRTSVG